MLQSDEEFARQLIEVFLRASQCAEAQCELVERDPPDIKCRIGSEVWAVEVTRVGEREIQHGTEKSRSEIDRPLMEFGRVLGELTSKYRTLKYLLILNGPPDKNWNRWKKSTRKIVERFIRSGKIENCNFSGGSITAFESGADWIVAGGLREEVSIPGGGITSDISANIEVMLRHALDDKARKLKIVSGFDKISLVLLNTYFFADNTQEVRQILQTIVGEDQKYALFDYIYFVANGQLHLVFSRSPHPALSR